MNRQRGRNVPSRPVRSFPTTDATSTSVGKERTLPLNSADYDDLTSWKPSREEETSGRTIPGIVRLPSQEAMTVELAPLNLVERLDQYQEDVASANIIAGLFWGAASGIIVNWVTADPFYASRNSIVILIVFVALGFRSFFWVRRLKERSADVKNKLREQTRKVTSSLSS